MFILDTVNTVSQDCGWLPPATVQLIANIYTIIKFLVPLLIIIMGSIDFLKAVMAQQDDQMKKAQSAFLQKLIAGALVFFVAVIVGWVVKLISDLDTKGETTAGNTATCLNLMLNGGYRQNNKDYSNNDSNNNNNSNDNNTDNNNSNDDDCELRPEISEEIYKTKLEGCSKITKDEYKQGTQYMKCKKDMWLDDPLLTFDSNDVLDSCYAVDVEQEYNKCINNIKKDYCKTKEEIEHTNQEIEFNNCLDQAHCTLSTIDTDNCRSCLNASEVEKYKYLKEKAKKDCTYQYMEDGINSFYPACIEDFYTKPNVFEDMGSKDLYKYCSNAIGSITKEGKEECCLNLYEKFNEKQNECIDTYTSTAKTDIVNWYCDKYPDQC